MSQETKAVDNPVAVVDEYGRDAAERTVELTPADAEAIDKEVDAGKHETFDGALSYVINRGLIEIKRVRDSAAKLREANKLRDKVKLYEQMLKLNPALITDPKFAQQFTAAMLAVNGNGSQAK